MLFMLQPFQHMYRIVLLPERAYQRGERTLSGRGASRQLPEALLPLPRAEGHVEPLVTEETLRMASRGRGSFTSPPADTG